MPNTESQPISLKARVLRSGSWTIVGYGMQQVLRFASNLLLTRLLFPEAFGLAALVQAVIVGVTMLSDVGIAQGIVRSPSGGEPRYYNTAWTIQVIKGVLLGIVIWVLAHPLAIGYGQPQLEGLLWVAALISVVQGFNSTKVALADRKVDAFRVTSIELGSLAINIISTALLAWWHPSPWALVWGNFIGTLAKMLGSHFLLPGGKNHWCLDKVAARDVLTFGSMVLVGSALTFFVGEGNKLLAGSLVSVHLLALIGLASTLNMTVSFAALQLASRVFFPAYAEILNTNPSRFSATVARGRLAQIIPVWSVAMVCCLFGPNIVGLLYDHRYAGAGTILQFQALGLLVGTLTNSYSAVLLALGRVWTNTILMTLQVLIQWASMWIGYHYMGPAGVVIGWATVGWTIYVVNAYIFSKLNILHPKIDIPVWVMSIGVALLTLSRIDWGIVQSWN